MTDVHANAAHQHGGMQRESPQHCQLRKALGVEDEGPATPPHTPRERSLRDVGHHTPMLAGSLGAGEIDGHAAQDQVLTCPTTLRVLLPKRR